ncbi:MAG: glycosyltransferase family 2 protein [bacterium]
MSAVDVLLPVRDAAPTISETLDSIRRQTLDDFRCLVLDDGSTDASAAIAEELIRADPRFVVRRFPPRGLVATLNDGLDEVAAPFVARIDADDVMEEERLALQVERLHEDPDVDAVSCRVRFFGDVSPRQRAYEAWLNSLVAHDEIVRDLFVESPLAHPSVTVRTERLRALGGWRDFDGPEDYDLWLRAWRAGWTFAKVPRTLVRIRHHHRRLTRVDPRYARRAFLDCKAEHLVDAVGLGGRDAIVWGAGRDGIRAAKALRRRGVAIRCLVDVAATKIGRRTMGVAVLPHEMLREKPGCFVVVAVGVQGARSEIRETLARWGYRELEEFVCFG